MKIKLLDYGVELEATEQDLATVILELAKPENSLQRHVQGVIDMLQKRIKELEVLCAPIIEARTAETNAASREGA